MAKPALAVHVRHEDRGWRVVQDGTDEPIAIEEDRDAAIAKARDVANADNAEVILHPESDEILKIADFRIEQRDERE